MRSFALVLLLAAASHAYHVKQLQEVEPVEKVIEPIAKEQLSFEQEQWEAEGRALSAQEYDKQAFFDMLDTLLWDADSDEDITDAEGRTMQLYHRRGLLRMSKPAVLQDEDGFAGRMYRNLQDKCYTGFCALGLGGFSTAFFDLFSAIFK